MGAHAIVVRTATPADVPLILSYIRQLAEYERLSHEVTATAANLEQWLFSPSRLAEAILAELDGQPSGFALFFHNFSTFLARPGLYLEDLFVIPSARGQGVGKAMLARLAQIAIDRGCGRLEWSVLDWNLPAVEFYRAIGAQPMDQWTVHRLTGPALERMAMACGSVGPTMP